MKQNFKKYYQVEVYNETDWFTCFESVDYEQTADKLVQLRSQYLEVKFRLIEKTIITEIRIFDN